MKYIIGDTIRCTVSFTNFLGQAVDPQLIKFITYDKWYNKLDEVSIGNQNKNSTGNYYYDFVIPSSEGEMYYEWYGEIDGKPSIDRKKISKTFV